MLSGQPAGSCSQPPGGVPGFGYKWVERYLYTHPLLASSQEKWGRRWVGRISWACFYVVEGFLISTGEPKRHYISKAVRHVNMRQGMLGVRVELESC